MGMYRQTKGPNSFCMSIPIGMQVRKHNITRTIHKKLKLKIKRFLVKMDGHKKNAPSEIISNRYA